jgi:DNA helicase-2/ATP-dependent DNA helicase PcrA
MLAADVAEEALGVLQRVLPAREDIAAGVKIILQYRAEPQIALRVATQHMNGTYANRYDRWESRAADLRLLADLARRYKDLLGFIEAYTMDPVSNTEEEGVDSEDLVTLITVHSAKGTEAPVCYCIGVQPGVYPHLRSLGDKEAEEEERRVLYVALTRAQNELFITRSGEDSHTVFHGGSYAHSVGTPYFLEHLPPERVRHEHFGYGMGTARGSVLDSLLDWKE